MKRPAIQHVPLSWLPAVWVLVGTEILLIIGVVSGIPPSSEPGPDGVEPLLFDLKRSMALANLIVVLGVWVQTRSPHRRREVIGAPGLLMVLTAVSLVLPPLLLRDAGQRMPTARLIAAQVWIRGTDGEYRSEHAAERAVSPP